jgi:arylformamidase
MQPKEGWVDASDRTGTAPPRGRFVELGHALEDGMATYPGLPAARIGPFLDHEASRTHYEEPTEFFLGVVEMPCNVGTYLDSPFHRFREGRDLSEIPLESVAGLPGVVIDAPGEPGKGITLHAQEDAITGRAVLVRTGWDERWGSEGYWLGGPYLTQASVDLLVRAGAALVGVDFSNVDDTSDRSRPVHTQLLRANVLIVEHLCDLALLPSDGFAFSAVPLRVVRGASFSVRAFAEIPSI